MAEEIPVFEPLTCPVAKDGDKSDVAVGGDAQDEEKGISQKFGIPPIFSTPIQDGGQFFKRADLNALFNLVSQYQYFLQAGGFLTFDEATANVIGGYPEGAILFHSAGDDSCFVMSAKDGNRDDFTKRPILISDTRTDDTSWLKLTPTINDFKRGADNVRIVDELPSALDEGVYYFVRGN